MQRAIYCVGLPPPGDGPGSGGQLQVFVEYHHVCPQRRLHYPTPGPHQEDVLHQSGHAEGSVHGHQRHNIVQLSEGGSQHSHPGTPLV